MSGRGGWLAGRGAACPPPGRAARPPREYFGQGEGAGHGA